MTELPPSYSLPLEGRVAIVTGAAGGLGRVFCLALAAAGARLVAADVSGEGVDQTAEAVIAAGGEAIAVAVDVASRIETERMAATAVDHWDRVDILVNNAGLYATLSRRPFYELPLEEWDRVMAVNAKGVFLGTKHAIPAMRRSGGGSIVNISSIAGIGQSQHQEPAYAASKGAIRIFTKVTASQHARDGIRCNSVHPGPVDTEMFHQAFADPEVMARRLQRIPLGKPSSVERDYFPSLIRDKQTFIAHVSDGYWLDIGTPSKYRQAHADIMTGRFKAAPFHKAPRGTVVSPSASIARDAVIGSPCFIGDGAVIGGGARIGAHSVVGSGCRIGMNAILDGTILWPDTHVGDEAHLGPIVAGRNCRIGQHTSITGDGMLGDDSVVTDYSRLGT